MTQRWGLIFGGWCAWMCLTPAFAQTPDTPRLKALLICGGCCHDYHAQKQIICQGLAQRLSIHCDVVHEGDDREHMVSVYRKPGWWRGYDVILHNECYGKVTDPEFVGQILAAHTDGSVPAVFIHCAMHSYRDSCAADGWRELLGVTSKRHEKAHPETVTRVDDEHPVMKGFPKTWTTPHGELYVIEKVWPNCTPLATATANNKNESYPVAWVNTLGKTRVFATTLGHANQTMMTEEWLGMVSRGTLWAVGRLQEDGTPEAGFAGKGIGPIEIVPVSAAPEVDPKFRPKP